MQSPTTQNQSSFREPTIIQLSAIKTVLKPLEFLSRIPEKVSETLNIGDIQALMRFAVLQHLRRKILNGSKEEMGEARAFIVDASDKISHKLEISQPAKKRYKKKHPRLAGVIEEQSLDELILRSVVHYTNLLAQISGIKVLDEKAKKDLVTPTHIQGVVEIAVKKALGWNSNESIVHDSVERVSKKISALQNIPEYSGFHKLPQAYKECIVKNENFGIGFTLQDLEKISFSGIRKFTIQALDMFLTSLRVSDEARFNKIEDMARNIVGVQAVTEDMIERSNAGYDMVRIDS